MDTKQPPELSAGLEEFREALAHTGACTRLIVFERLAASHVVVQIFVSDCEWWESEALSVNICLRVHTTGHQTTLNYPLLGGISRALPTRVLHSADRFRAACCITRCGPNFCFPIVNGGSQRHSLSISVCVFTHWTPNNPELSAAWRNFASSCPHGCCTRLIVFERLLHHTLWSKFLFPNCEWWESEDTLCQYLFACSHTGHQTTLNYPLLGGISRALATLGVHSADRFRAAAASHVVVQILFPIVNGGSRDTLCQYLFACSHTGHQTDPELSVCLEEFRELLPTRVLHSA
ncbi:hypothetical protein TcYC6_0023960 [Trypanosoma cruzi]|nr:hypothetical protein TcYC6_0023960 [Trypanosoma cruzi]